MRVTSPRNVVALLAFALVSLAVSQCTALRPNKETFCTTGNGSPYRPLICIDEQTLTASPLTARVADVEAVDKRATNRPVTVHWFSRRTAPLKIEFAESTCVTPPVCDGQGHCYATVLPLQEKRSRQCRYHVSLTDNSKADPDGFLVVDPCCW